ncbi:uncharacterized protein UBRO_20256 [Ustilago bromivora]|uniref:Reverse transcriptase RNase H-like domain-containing protein n=1 Tax=Ustilago bromivora TaxID=307758 RepID=A0A1K0GPJ6_9BASI|nr:uncharacterized protein UBRO_20256 [Ustilago bromivora]
MGVIQFCKLDVVYMPDFSQPSYLFRWTKLVSIGSHHPPPCTPNTPLNAIRLLTAAQPYVSTVADLKSQEPPFADVSTADFGQADHSIQDDEIEDQAAQWMLSTDDGKPDDISEECAERVTQALKIQFGEQGTPEECQHLQALLKVKHLAFAETASDCKQNCVIICDPKLIEEPPDIARHSKMQALSPPQKEFLHQQVHELINNGFLIKVPGDQVRWISETHIVPKPAAEIKSNVSIEELQHQVNTSLKAAGLEHDPNMPNPTPLPTQLPEAQTTKACYQLVHNYTPINCYMCDAAFIPGDITVKVSKLLNKKFLFKGDGCAGFFIVANSPLATLLSVTYIKDLGFCSYAVMLFGFKPLATSLIGIATSGWMMLQLVIKTLVPTSHGFEHFWIEPSTLGSLLGWPRPGTVRELMVFQGVCSYLRSIISSFAKIFVPLDELTQHIDNHDQDICEAWASKHEAAFLRVKQALVSSGVLKEPRYDRPFVVQSDWSAEGMGAVLLQEYEVYKDASGQWQLDIDSIYGEQEHPCKKIAFPIAYASCKCLPSESCYSAHLGELAAAKFALDKFACFTFGQPIILVTDCTVLRDILRSEKMPAAHARWREQLLAHNVIEVHHYARCRHLLAQGLSHQKSASVDESQEPLEDAGYAFVRAISADDLASESQSLAQRYIELDPQASELLKRFEGDELEPLLHLLLLEPPMPQQQQVRLRHQASYVLHKGELSYVQDKQILQVLPHKEARPYVLSIHDCSHAGVAITINIL